MRELLLACMTWRTLGQNTGGFYFGPAGDKSGGECTDNKGQSIPEGLLFTPGPDECQVCTCLRQMAVLCRTVLCAPPKNCVSLRVGDACCQWICDDWAVSDIGLRLVASAVTAILSLSLLFFLIYRLRQRRLRSRQNHLQAESYNSVIGQTDDCWVGDTQLSSYGVDWRKPLDGTFNRPFPPSYDEAVSCTSNLGGSPAPPYQEPALSYPEHGPPFPEQGPTYPEQGQSYPEHPLPYQVATLGRRVLPVGPDSTRTLPAILRRVRRSPRSSEPEPRNIDAVDRPTEGSSRHINPLFRHSLQHEITDESLNEPNRRGSGTARPSSSSDIYSAVEEAESCAPYSFREIRSRVEERSRAENRARAEDRSRALDRGKAGDRSKEEDRFRADERSSAEDRSRLENRPVDEEDDLPSPAIRSVPSPGEPRLDDGSGAPEGEPYLTQTTV